MNDKFDELAKAMAQSVTRRGALKKFGMGVAGIALASLGLASKAETAPHCKTATDCANLGLIYPGCCSGKCVDLWVDSSHCGACRQQCRRSSMCYNGGCIPLP